VLRSQPGEPVSDKVRRAAFWILIFVALGAITAGVTAASGRNDVPDVTVTGRILASPPGLLRRRNGPPRSRGAVR
jgi:hypothetical protein